MPPLSPLLVLALVLFILALSLAALRYWMLEPVKAQAAVRTVLTPVFDVLKRVSYVIVSTAIMTIKFFVGWFIGLAFILLMAVHGEKVSITIKFS